MKYSIIFAATAAAYDAYGNGHHEEPKSSTVVKPSATKPACLTTVYPGYGKQPVTVTTQHQPYPTCVSAGYGGKTCDKWGEDTYVHTTIKDYDNNYKVITKTDEPVTVYHTTKTITHSATAGYAAPTGSAYNKNGTDGCWYELYEKVEEVPYKQLGPHALPGYPGSGLYPQGDKEQPVKVKEYKGGKWSEYEHVNKYGKPEEEVKTYEKPGVYTIPAKDVYVDKPVTHPAEATATAKAGETCIYGGAYADAKSTGYVTGAYGAYETKYVSGKPVTETVVKYTTVYVTKTGKVEIAKPTTTVYDHDTEVVYPTAKSYEAGYYHQDAKVITVTKSGEAYTCSYEKQKPTGTPKKDDGYPVYPTKTPSHDDYGYYNSKPSATPKELTDEDKYPVYPVKGNGIYDQYEAKSTPVAVYSKEYKHGDYSVSSYPVAASTPCESDKKPAPTAYKPYGGEYPYGQESKSVPAAQSTPVDNDYPLPTPSEPAYNDNKDDYPAEPVESAPVYKRTLGLLYEHFKNKFPAQPAKYPAQPAQPAKYPAQPAQPAKYPAQPAQPAKYPAQPAQPAKYTPVYEHNKDKYTAPTPAYTENKGYGAGYKRSRIARAI